MTEKVRWVDFSQRRKSQRLEALASSCSTFKRCPIIEAT